MILARGSTPYLPLQPDFISYTYIETRLSRNRHAEHHEAMRDPQLSPLALALYAFNVQAVRLLCLFHEPNKTNFFELLDFATIDCFFECFASSDTRASDLFDSFDDSDSPGWFWPDSSDGSNCDGSSDYSDLSQYSRECIYLCRYRDTFNALLKYGPTIEQNSLDHELVLALKIRNLPAARVLTPHGARLSAEAAKIRADLVISIYCKLDWSMRPVLRLLRETFTGCLGRGLTKPWTDWKQ